MTVLYWCLVFLVDIPHCHEYVCQRISPPESDIPEEDAPKSLKRDENSVLMCCAVPEMIAIIYNIVFVVVMGYKYVDL